MATEVELALGRANMLRAEGRHGEAWTLLLELLKSNPDNASVAFHCAEVNDNLGLEEEAVRFYTRAIELQLSGKELERAFVGLGSSYRCLGQFVDSVKVLEKATQLFPENWSVKVFLAITYHEYGRYDEAIELLLKCISETSSDPTIRYYDKAIAYYSNCNNRN
jgi:tetratricopeptide (TPR) repeat protein